MCAPLLLLPLAAGWPGQGSWVPGAMITTFVPTADPSVAGWQRQYQPLPANPPPPPPSLCPTPGELVVPNEKLGLQLAPPKSADEEERRVWLGRMRKWRDGCRRCVSSVPWTAGCLSYRSLAAVDHVRG